MPDVIDPAPATATEPTTGTAEAAQPAEPDWKAEAQKWEKRSKENYAKLKEAEPKLTEYERLMQASKTEDERRAEELVRWQTEAEKWRGASVSSRIEALATGIFADPTDAVTALAEPGKYLGADGAINSDAIKSDLADLLTRKPHWAAGQTEADDAATVARAPWFNPAQAASAAGYVNGPSSPSGSPADQFAALIQTALRK
jgi:hypothetical protein